MPAFLFVRPRPPHPALRATFSPTGRRKRLLLRL
jgi:hypothetical protein